MTIVTEVIFHLDAEYSLEQIITILQECSSLHGEDASARCDGTNIGSMNKLVIRSQVGPK